MNARKNGTYVVEYWDSQRGLWIDVYETPRANRKQLQIASDMRERRCRSHPGKWRIVHVTKDSVQQVG